MIGEVSLALVLLVSAVLLLRTLFALHMVNPGFASDHVLTLEMSLNGPHYQNTGGITQLLRDGRDRLNALPGVELAGASFWLPNDVEDATGLHGFHIDGRPVRRDCCGSKWMSITPGYLRLYKIPVLRGRHFTRDDNTDAPHVALINEAFARKFFPREDPIGKHIDHGATRLQRGVETIIGVVGDFHDSGLARPANAMMIVLIVQASDEYNAAYASIQPLFWVLRTNGDPHQCIPAITKQLRIANRGFTVAHIRTMDEVMGLSTSRQRFNMLLRVIFGALALFLAAFGIYGLMAYSVAQRTQEMGIRVALGADRSAIRKLVVWHGMRLAMTGVLVGIVAAFGLTRLLSCLLFGVKALDVAAFVSAPLVLAAVALIAVWLPAARASKVDPMQALRAE